MKLTGKCKTEFLKYLDVEEQWFNEEYTDLFENALIIEFFDSVGIYIEIFTDKYFNNVIFDSYVDNEWIGASFKTRNEAINEAIIKANETFNSK